MAHDRTITTSTTTRPSTPTRSIDVDLPDTAFTMEPTAASSAAASSTPARRCLLRAVAAARATGDLLDLGCGAGPIALTMARRSPAATVWAVDVNDRARDLCARNAERNGIDNVGSPPRRRSPGRPVRDDLVEPADPDRQGGAPRAPRRLARSAHAGRDAALVVQKHLGADSLQTWLTERRVPEPSGSPRSPASALPPIRSDVPPDAETRRLRSRGRVDLDAHTAARHALRRVEGLAERVQSAARTRTPRPSPPTRSPPDRAARRSRLAPAPDTTASAPYGGRPSSGAGARSPSTTMLGVAGRAARSTSWAGVNVWTRTSGAIRPARTISASACSAARKRGASISESNSRNATTSARRTRCRRASVPT